MNLGALKSLVFFLFISFSPPLFSQYIESKKAEIKIGFRFIFQSKNTTITETQVNELIGVIINHTEKIKGVTIPGLN